MVTIEDIRSLYRERSNSDRKISIGLTIIASLSTLLTIVVVIAYVIAMLSMIATPQTSPIEVSTPEYPPTIQPGETMVPGILGILSLIGGVILIGILFVVLEIYVFYRWLDARNKHFNRSREFYRAVAEYLSERVSGDAKDKVEEFKGSVDTLWNMKRRDIGSVVWAILAAIFSLGMYLLMHITIDYYIHRKLEEEVSIKLNDVFTALGLPKAEWRETFEEREVLLYALLTLLTLGLFQIYWYYVISKDQNEHFDTHSRFEEQVINNLEKI